jgi:hypothetical protein
MVIRSVPFAKWRGLPQQYRLHVAGCSLNRAIAFEFVQHGQPNQL